MLAGPHAGHGGELLPVLAEERLDLVEGGVRTLQQQGAELAQVHVELGVQHPQHHLVLMYH